MIKDVIFIKKEYVYLFFSLQILIFISYLLKFLIFCIRRYFDSRKYYKITRDDKEKFVYFRDIIKECSIGELGYIFNEKKNINSIVMAEIEYLKLNKKIEIVNKNINIIDDTNLRKSEKFIIESYKFIGTKYFNKLYIESIESSLKEKNLIKTYKFFSKSLNIINIIVFFFNLIYWFVYLKYIWSTNASSYIAFCFGMMLITTMLLMLSVYINDKVVYIKTEDGKEIYMKLNGLKKFIRDFGNFDDKSLREIIIWEDYLLYAIILNESKLLKKELTNAFGEDFS